MKVDYGVRALVELAQHDGDAPLQTSAIAGRQGIPEAYLDQVLTILHKAGFIRSRRGPLGGHFLALAPVDINLGMVMNTLDGKSPLLDCLVEPADCRFSEACAQREVWGFLEEAVQELLRTTTIAEIARRQSRLTADRALHLV